MNFHVIFILFISFQVFSSDCSFNVGGKNYDLSSIGTSAPFTLSNADGTFSLGLCTNNAHPCQERDGSLSAFVDNAQTECQGVLARWGSGSPTALAADGGVTGILLHFNSGDNCGGLGSDEKYDVKLTIECDASTTTPTFSHIEPKSVTDPCYFEATLKVAPTVCSGAGPSTGGSGGFSGGWIFIVIFFSLLIVYLIAGIVYQMKYVEEEEKGMCPQPGFWKKLLFWFITGNKVSWAFTYSACLMLKGKICKRKDSEGEGDEVMTGYGDDDM